MVPVIGRGVVDGTADLGKYRVIYSGGIKCTRGTPKERYTQNVIPQHRSSVSYTLYGPRNIDKRAQDHLMSLGLGVPVTACVLSLHTALTQNG